MNAKRNMASTVGKVITYILLILAVAGIVGFFAFFTNGFTEEFKSFYIEQDGKPVLNTNTSTNMDFGKTYSFNVKYVFDDLTDSENKGYFVKIVPNTNTDTDFLFTADGDEIAFSWIKELTSAFTINRQTDSFTVTIPEKFSMADVLGKIYKGSEIILPEDFDESEYWYRLEVSSYNGEITYNISFRLGADVQSIELDYSQIIFPSGTTVDATNEEVVLSDEAVQFRQYVEGACQADYNGAVTLLSKADAEYEKLPEEEKGLPYVATAYKAKECLGNSLKSGQITAEAREQALAYLSKYKEE